MRKTVLATALLSLCLAGSALASWKVQNGDAIIETENSAALTLTCDNNANTNFARGWLVRVDALDLRRMGPRVRATFRFDGQRPLTVMADNRLGHVSIDSMTAPNQSDVNAIVNRLKAANRVTVTLIDDANGTAREPLAFNLRGSSRAIRSVQQACH